MRWLILTKGNVGLFYRSGLYLQKVEPLGMRESKGVCFQRMSDISDVEKIWIRKVCFQKKELVQLSFKTEVYSEKKQT